MYDSLYKYSIVYANFWIACSCSDAGNKNIDQVFTFFYPTFSPNYRQWNIQFWDESRLSIFQVNQIRDSLAIMGDNSTAFSLPQVGVCPVLCFAPPSTLTFHRYVPWIWLTTYIISRGLCGCVGKAPLLSAPPLIRERVLAVIAVMGGRGFTGLPIVCTLVSILWWQNLPCIVLASGIFFWRGLF